MRSPTRSIIFLTLSVTSVAASPISVNLNAPATRDISILPRVTANPKRGLVYDYLSQDFGKLYVGSKCSFGSDWHGTRDETGSTLHPSFNFIPTLRVDNNLKNDKWIDSTKSIIKGGAKFVFAYVTPRPPPFLWRKKKPLSSKSYGNINGSDHRSSGPTNQITPNKPT